MYHPSGNRRSIELRRRGAETAARCGGLSLEDRILRESAKANLPLTLAPPTRPWENCHGAWAVVANHLGKAYFPITLALSKQRRFHQLTLSWALEIKLLPIVGHLDGQDFSLFDLPGENQL